MRSISVSFSTILNITFRLIIKRLFFFQTYSTLWSIPTNQPQHILFKNYNNSHHSITYTSYFHQLLTQLLHYHIIHTTNSISFSRSQQFISRSFHPQNPSTLSSPSHLLQTTHFNHHPSQFFPKLLLPYHSAYQNSTSQPEPQIAHQAYRHTAGHACTLQDVGLHRF